MSRLIDALRRGGGSRTSAPRPAAPRADAQTDSVLAALGYARGTRLRGSTRRGAQIVLASGVVLLLAFAVRTVVRTMVNATAPSSRGGSPSARRQGEPPLGPDPAPGASRARGAQAPPAADGPPPLPPRTTMPADVVRSEEPTRPDTRATDRPPPASHPPAPVAAHRVPVERAGSSLRSAARTRVASVAARKPGPPPLPSPPRDPTRVQQVPSAGGAAPAGPAATTGAPEGDHFKLALYYQRAGDFDAALGHYRALLQRNELNTEAHNNLGLLFQQKGLLDQAVQEFQRAILIDPRYGKAHNNLGVTLLRMGNADAAATEFQAVLAADPKNVDALVNLALAFKAAGSAGQAQETLLRALGVESGHAAAHYNLALLYEQDQETARAIEHYRAFLAHAGVDYASLAADVRKRVETLSAQLGPR